jgi:hypothetical protein
MKINLLRVGLKALFHTQLLKGIGKILLLLTVDMAYKRFRKWLSSW